METMLKVVKRLELIFGLTGPPTPDFPRARLRGSVSLSGGLDLLQKKRSVSRKILKTKGRNFSCLLDLWFYR